MLLAALAAGPATAEGKSYDVPSGQPVSLLEAIWEDGAAAPLRLRFLAPRIAQADGGITFAEAESDLAHLCKTVALPLIAEAGRTPARVIVSLSDRAVPHGQADPEATQFFEAFRPEDGRCIWEAF
ncbi:acetolactate synthase [Maritimibacter sp. 55A14]|nr:acetolactate synthase [Maritimibacter sp. 55A14]